MSGSGWWLRCCRLQDKRDEVVRCKARPPVDKGMADIRLLVIDTNGYVHVQGRMRTNQRPQGYPTMSLDRAAACPNELFIH